ncbi:cysteine desulfurase family protein [Hominiventricola filiformis]|uniref:Cysteine desulfurase n=1 Tax=Hominiventricola filiformis TaxID=2885352 RepID=A0AAE3A652_9FIRM|nr:cysteine desulfurase family protein [Hominiventricola filiformis]MCC2124645.1 cysteine desulfurase [Hominiventricola filiformis]
MEAYLDNSATTRCSAKAAEMVMKVMREDFGNPSALHTKGVEAEHYVKEARAFFAKNLKVDEKEICFTSGGTESNNLALIGTAMANRRAGNHLITTSVEHASVDNTMKYLEEQGFRVTYLPVDEYGVVSLEALKEALCPETILVSVMYVNNEVGAVQPVDEIARIVKEHNPNTIFHVDAIQAYGKYRIYPKKEGIDLLSVSGHKIHGPKGTGFLYVNSKVKIHSIVFGGGQQKGLRSGTENVPGIAGMAEAAAECYENLEEKIDRLYALKDRFVSQVSALEGTKVNGHTGRDSAPQIVSVSFRNVRSEVLLHALEEKGIYVSAGSACSSNKPSVSRTLKNMEIDKELLGSTLRFSFCFDTTEEEIDYCIKELGELLPVLRRYVRR